MPLYQAAEPAVFDDDESLNELWGLSYRILALMTGFQLLPSPPQPVASFPMVECLTRGAFGCKWWDQHC
jgi:hypothetical protein